LQHDEPESRPKTAGVDRLRRVRVCSLFGIFDHEIPLNLDSRITIIHGPNGVGKTVILRMIHALLSAGSTGIEVLTRVPFAEFELEFESGDRVVVNQGSERSEGGGRDLHCEIHVGNTSTVIPLGVEPYAAAIRAVSEHIDDSWRYVRQGVWEDLRDGEIISSEELGRRYQVPENLVREVRLSPAIREISGKCRARLIGTDRLLTEARDIDGALEPSLSHRSLLLRRRMMQRDESKQKTIAFCSQDLTQRFREALSTYGSLTEQLDRSLVSRLLSKDHPRKTPEQLLALFKDLDEKRRRLVNLGLLNVQEDLLGQGASDEEVLDLVSNSTDVFSLYVHDMQRKLEVFDQLQTKLEILIGRTNQRFQFKQLSITRENGFEFKSEAGALVPAPDLSSGEQHEMILLYELLFIVEAGELVLIDEPEISLHLEWQMALLDDLKAAFLASNVDVLMATHSPAIARSMPEALVSLGSRTD